MSHPLINAKFAAEQSIEWLDEAIRDLEDDYPEEAQAQNVWPALDQTIKNLRELKARLEADIKTALAPIQKDIDAADKAEMEMDGGE